MSYRFATPACRASGEQQFSFAFCSWMAHVEILVDSGIGRPAALACTALPQHLVYKYSYLHINRHLGVVACDAGTATPHGFNGWQLRLRGAPGAFRAEATLSTCQ